MLANCKSVLGQVLDKKLILKVIILLSHLNNHILLVRLFAVQSNLRWLASNRRLTLRLLRAGYLIDCRTCCVDGALCPRPRKEISVVVPDCLLKNSLPQLLVWRKHVRLASVQGTMGSWAQHFVKQILARLIKLAVSELRSIMLGAIL